MSPVGDIRMPSRIELADLPNELRALADKMTRVGAAVRFYGGVGPFGEWGDLLVGQSAPMCREIAAAMDRMRPPEGGVCP